VRQARRAPFTALLRRSLAKVRQFGSKPVLSATLFADTENALAAMSVQRKNGHQTDLSFILKSLGCHYAHRDTPTEDRRVITPSLPPSSGTLLPECLGHLLIASLPNLNGAQDAMVSLTSGVHRHGLTTAFAANEDTAYAMAAALLHYAEKFTGSYLMDVAVRMDLTTILNDWLKPEVQWELYPSVDQIAGELFGDWRACLFDADIEEMLIGDYVFLHRPPFLPGLCPAQDKLTIMLPAMDINI
jgi:hypothetical protein